MKCQRNKFLLSRKTAYINCANMGPLMKKVVNAGKKGIMRKVQPNKLSADDYFNEVQTLKILFSELINNPEPKRVTSIPSASYGIAAAAKNISAGSGDNIVVLEAQFPSNIYAWMELSKRTGAELRTVTAPDTTDRRGEKWNEKIIEAIDQNTRAVALGNVHWSDGTLFDLKAIRQKCDETDAYLIVDGTQSIGALPFDIQEIRPDALVVAAYKWLLGPYSIGMAYYGEKFADGDPLEYPWINRLHSEKFSHLVNYQDEYQPESIRFDMGEKSNFILNPMLIESLKQVIKWTPEAIQSYTRDLNRAYINEIKELGFYIEDEDLRSSHIFGVKINNSQLEPIQKSLKNNRVSASFRGDFVRISPHVYNDDRDMKKLVKAFSMIVK